MRIAKAHITFLTVSIVLLISGFCYGQRPPNISRFSNPSGSSVNSNTSRSSSNSGQRPTPQGIKEIFPPRERDWKPSILKLSYDAIPLGLTVFSEARSGQGFQATIDFDQYFLAMEYGHQQSERGQGYGFEYKNSGQYFSIGPEVNFLKNTISGTAFTFGLRYGQAQFSDELKFSVDSTFFGSYDVFDSNPDLKASWMELTLGLTTDVWKDMFIGYTVRYKVFRNVKNIGDMAPYDVPGFGLYEDNTGVQFNFYIGWGIRFREKALPGELKN